MSALCQVRRHMLVFEHCNFFARDDIVLQVCVGTVQALCLRTNGGLASHRFPHRACCARRCHLLLLGANQDGIAHAAVCAGLCWVQVLRDARQQRAIRGALQALQVADSAVAPHKKAALCCAYNARGSCLIIFQARAS